jgi:hypothetical protein
MKPAESLITAILAALTLGFYSAIVFGIWKIFQIARDVAEIKRILRAMRERRE